MVKIPKQRLIAEIDRPQRLQHRLHIHFQQADGIYPAWGYPLLSAKGTGDVMEAAVAISM